MKQFYRRIQKVLFLVTCFAFYATLANAQTITLRTIDPGPYSPGSTIAVPFDIANGSGCIQQDNVYNLYISSTPGGIPDQQIGTFSGFYATFVNGTIPTGLADGSYNLEIRSTSPVKISTRASIDIRAGNVVTAGIDGDAINASTSDVFGNCTGSSPSFDFSNTSTQGASVTANFYNELDKIDVVTSNVNPSTSFNAEQANYTILVKAVYNGITGTKAFQLINNIVNTTFGTSGSNVVCLSNGRGDLFYTVDVSSANGIQKNYPGNVYIINWGDGTPYSIYTLCQIQALNGRISHTYESSSCGNTNGGQTNTFPVNIRTSSPYCQQIGSSITSSAIVLSPPTNNFTGPNSACLNELVTFTNSSDPGQSSSGTGANCTNTAARYSWYVDGQLINANYGYNQVFTHTFTTTGQHTITLRLQQSSSPCSATDISKTICILRKPTPQFSLPVSTICNSGTITPHDESITDQICNAISENNVYHWNVTGPGSYTYVGGTDASTHEPEIQFSAPGIYQISLTISTETCGEVTSAVQNIIVNTTPTVTLSPSYPICGNNQTLIFDDTNNSPTRTTFSGTTAEQPDTYTWTVTGGNYAFQTGYNANSKYPHIIFYDYGVYTVTATHTNNCGTDSKSQQLDFRQSPSINAGTDQTICPGDVVQLNGSISDPTQTNYRWLGGNDASFSPDRFALNATYTPTAADIDGGQVTLTLQLLTNNPAPCDRITDDVVINIFPRNAVTNGNPTANVCTNEYFTFNPTAQVPGSTFRYTSTTSSSSVRGNTANGTGNINDQLFYDNPTGSGTVTYVITPVSNNNCNGTPYTVTVTVYPRPVITVVNNVTICSSKRAGVTFSSTITPTTYKWTSIASSADISGNTNRPTAINDNRIDDLLSNASYTTSGTVTYYITPVGPNGCEGATATVTVTVQPQPVLANAGPDKSICAESSYTLEGNDPGISTGTWTFIPASGQSLNDVSFTNANQSNTVVNGLQPGQTYTFRWTLTGAAQCDPNSDEVIITNLRALTNTFSFSNPTVCYGQTVTALGSVPTGGTGSYVYSWESSPDGSANTWQTITGENGRNLSFTGTQSIYIRRTVTSGECSSISPALQVIVLPQIAGNTITRDQSICYSTAPELLTGSTPTGGDGSNYTYIWQSSASGSTSWTTLANSNTTDYQPGVLTTTTRFRRLVTSAQCSGAQQSESNVITITVKPQNTNTVTSPSSATICTNTTFNYQPAAQQTGTVFTWVSSASPNISGNSASGTGSISDVLVNSDLNNNGTVTYTITPINDGCPGQAFPLTVTVTPRPTVTVTGSGNSICSGTSTGIGLSTNFNGVSIRWTTDPVPGITGNNNHNATITTGINDFLYSTLNVSANVVYHITPVSPGGCDGPTVDATITILPQPVPANAGTDDAICSAATYTLNGNNPAAPSTGKWTLTTGQNGVYFTDDTRYNTTVNGLQPGNEYTFRWTITSTGACSTSFDDVMIKNLREVINTISYPNSAICFGETVTVTGNQPTNGNGNYLYSWEGSTDGTNWTAISGANQISYTFTGSESIYLHRIVSSGPCTSTSNTVYIIVQPKIINNSIQQNQRICYNTAPDLLRGSTPQGANGNYFYQWLSSTDNGVTYFAINGATGIDYQPGILLRTTQFMRIVTSDLCYGDQKSVSNPVTITVNPENTNTITNGSNRIICTGRPFTYQPAAQQPNTAFTYTSSVTGSITGNTASGSGNITDVLVNNDPNNNGTVTYVITPYNDDCPGRPFTFTVTVTPVPVVFLTNNNTQICSNSATGITFRTNTPGVTLKWTTERVQGIYGNNNQYAVTATRIDDVLTSDITSPATVTYRITPISEGGCEGTPVDATVTVLPQPVTANAGADEAICNASTYTLNGNNPAPSTGRWTVSSGQTTVGFADPTRYNTAVSGLLAGQRYTFRWTITSTGACSTSADEVVINNLQPLTNNISFGAPAVCYGQTITIDGSQPTGGTGNYTYSWESSTNGTNWTAVTGQTGSNYSFTGTQSIYIRRIVNSLPCNSISQPVYIVVQQPITNNTIGSNQQVCYNYTPQMLTGSTPSGADGNYFYQWQRSTNNGANWTDISGANGIDYQVNNLTVTTQFRRIVTSALCTGPQQSSSNSILIQVNPLPDATFTYRNDVGCIPYRLDAQNIKATPAEGNNTYTWYADNVLIGTGYEFPGYTIAQDDKQVVIKLVVTSRFGCEDVSFNHTFSTIKEVTASFVQDISKGCGPLTVRFSNTSTPQNAATYTWDFGNGTTSTAVNPAAVIFQPRSGGRDTIYTVTLRALTACGIRTFTSTVFVRPQPISIFTPDKTTGCSPLTVNFNNTSPGTDNTYTFDFGDGQTLVTNDRTNVSHTYTAASNQVFTVKMTVENECGKSTTQYNIRISPNTVLPQLVVNGDQKAGCAPWTVQFYNNTFGANYFTYDFGDGTILNTLDAPEVVTHTFLKDGIFNVKLTASNGCSDSTVYQSITVYAQPKTAFTSDLQSACGQTTVSFINQTPGSNTYAWDFGDGSTSVTANPTHSYAARSTPYTVTLIAKNTLGCTDTVVMKDYISVSVPPKAVFIVRPDSVITYPDYSFSFADRSINNPILWKWSFGDGISSASQNPSHTYRDTGSYVVRLIVYNLQGCADSVTHRVQITGVPGQLFVPNAFMPTSKFGELVTFKAKGSGLKTWRMRIFNKWGQVIWETNKLTDRGEPAEGWDGMMNGAPAPQGVYVWQIDATYINGKEWTGMSYKGSPPSRTGVIHLIQ